MGHQRTTDHYNGPPYHRTRPFRRLPHRIYDPRHRRHGPRRCTHPKQLQMGLLRLRPLRSLLCLVCLSSLPLPLLPLLTNLLAL